MDPVPVDGSSRILARTTKHLGAVDLPFISAPDMVVILMISTANLEGVDKSFALIIADEPKFCSINIDIGNGSLRELLSQLDHPFFELPIELDGHFILSLHTPVIIQIPRWRIVIVEKVHRQAPNWPSVVNPK